MLVFGHAGITLSAAVLLSGMLRSNRVSRATKKEAIRPLSRSFSKFETTNDFPNHKTSWLTPLVSRIDIRLLLIGSLLPDIIDKPIGLYFFRETFSNGRIFCHTLLFLILVTVTGLYFYRRRGKTWGLAFAFGTLTHLILDQMWRIPRTLLWPILGLNFERIDLSSWAANIFYALLTDPAVYMSELAGAVVLIWFTWVLLHRRKAYTFIKYGRIQ